MLKCILDSTGNVRGMIHHLLGGFKWDWKIEISADCIKRDTEYFLTKICNYSIYDENKFPAWSSNVPQEIFFNSFVYEGTKYIS